MKLSFSRKKESINYDIDVEAFATLMKEKDAVLIDIRWEGEIAEGSSIPGSKTINFFDKDFSERIGVLDRKHTYLVYCRSGVRGAKACKMMANMDFEKVYNLKGGILAWNAE